MTQRVAGELSCNNHTNERVLRVTGAHCISMAAPPAPCERALVVDDNEDMLASLRDVLEVSGVTVETTTSVQRAQEILAGGFEPSVILLDLKLGRGETGDDFAEKLRNDPRYRDIPLVGVSGDLNKLRRLRGVVFDRTFGKPFGVDALIRAMQELCGGNS